MKQTPAEREQEEDRAWQKAARKARHPHSHDHDHDKPSKRKRPRSPSGRRKKRHATPPDERERRPHEDGWVPPSPAAAGSKAAVDLDALRAEMEERRFREKLFDAMGDDAGMDDAEARFNEYDEYVPPRWRDSEQSHSRDDPSHMDDGQYAEWVREGMWRRTHKAEVEAQERAEEERKRKKDREKARREETRRMEREDAEKRARRRQVKDQQTIVDAWIAYDARWAQLRAGPPDSGGLAFTDLPWPCNPPPKLPLEPDTLSRQSISTFLLSPLHSVGKPRKQRLREALLLYHPDRFVAKWMGLVREKDAPGVQEAVGRVARVLTGLVEEGDQGE
jgi:hypothetical protein